MNDSGEQAASGKVGNLDLGLKKGSGRVFLGGSTAAQRRSCQSEDGHGPAAELDGAVGLGCPAYCQPQAGSLLILPHLEVTQLSQPGDVKQPSRTLVHP